MARAENHSMKRVVLCIVFLIILGSQSAHADYYFGEPRNCGPVINRSVADVEPCVSYDGLSLYYSQGTFGANLGLYVATRSSKEEAWGSPTRLGAQIQVPEYTGGQHVTSDGLTLYYSPMLSGGYGGPGDIWISTRASIDDPWGDPVIMEQPVSSPYEDWTPSLTRDNLSLCFMSTRPGGRGAMDLWMTTRQSEADAWQTPWNVGQTVNSPAFEGHPSLSADGRVLFFQSDRPGGSGSYDLWMTTRKTKDDAWSTPQNLGPGVNTAFMDSEPSISGDGFMLYFSSNRTGGQGDSDLWEVSIHPVIDFNGDYRIDIKDLQILIEHWGQDAPVVDMAPTPWGDGIVDGQDLEVFMKAYGQQLVDPSLLAHWKLDETEGDIAYDSVAENNGIVMGAALWVPDGGQTSGAIQLDGIDDSVETPFVLNPNEGVFSVFAWIKGGAPDQVIMSQKEGADWLAADDEGCLMTALISEGRRPGRPLVSDIMVTDGNWHRIGLVWDRTYRSLYVDDELAAVDVGVQDNFPSSRAELSLGAAGSRQAGTFWSGLIDDVQVYDRVVVP
ncbi:MAG: hypothetical protein K9N55_06790 [Phycisphaerae bacterium]|nr:hypothetical protein [Phycisphaerae bacterium]